jgi:ribonucleotide monophosphatase NagD (HAD superfamily)
LERSNLEGRTVMKTLEGGIMEMKMETKKKAVLVDIDGTLVTVTDNWSQERDLEWVQETMKAEKLEGGVALLTALHLMGYQLVFLTARGQTCKTNTWRKFREMGIDHMVDSIWHRPVAWNGVSSSVYKDWMIGRLKKKFNLQFAMEDEEKNQEVMRAHGLVVFDAKKWWK